MGRTLLAVGTLGTLLFSHSTSIFRPTLGVTQVPFCQGPARIGFFCLPGIELEAARWVAIGLLAVVASGWRPRVTGIIHWWVAYSLYVTGILVDGGDQATAVLTLLLVPVTLCDPREWHWGKGNVLPPQGREEVARLVALSGLVAIRVQVAGIYLHAAVSKFRVTEWSDGTAIYYWFTDPSYGMGSWLSPLLMPVLENALGVTMLTWGALVIEIFLFAGLLATTRYRKSLFFLGIMLHAGIAVVHGLISFTFAMWGALVLYLWPMNEEFRAVTAAGERLRRSIRTLRVRSWPMPRENLLSLGKE